MKNTKNQSGKNTQMNPTTENCKHTHNKGEACTHPQDSMQNCK